MSKQKRSTPQSNKLQGFNPTNPPDEAQEINQEALAEYLRKQPSAKKRTSLSEVRAQAKARGTLEESLVDQIEKGQLPKRLKAEPAK